MTSSASSELAVQLDSSGSLSAMIWVALNALIFILGIEVLAFLLKLCTSKRVLGERVLFLDLFIDTLLCCRFLRKRG